MFGRFRIKLLARKLYVLAPGSKLDDLFNKIFALEKSTRISIYLKYFDLGKELKKGYYHATFKKVKSYLVEQLNLNELESFTTSNFPASISYAEKDCITIYSNTIDRLYNSADHTPSIQLTLNMITAFFDNNVYREIDYNIEHKLEKYLDYDDIKILEEKLLSFLSNINDVEVNIAIGKHITTLIESWLTHKTPKHIEPKQKLFSLLNDICSKSQNSLLLSQYSQLKIRDEAKKVSDRLEELLEKCRCKEDSSYYPGNLHIPDDTVLLELCTIFKNNKDNRIKHNINQVYNKINENIKLLKQKYEDYENADKFQERLNFINNILNQLS